MPTVDPRNLSKSDGLPDPRKLRAVARLGDLCYLPADEWQVVEQSRPAVPRGKGVQDG